MTPNICKFLVVATMLVASSVATAQSSSFCREWVSLDGGIQVVFTGTNDLDFTMSFDNVVRPCWSTGAGTEINSLIAHCVGDEFDGQQRLHAMFWAPVSRDDPEGDAILIIGPEAFYSTCN